MTIPTEYKLSFCKILHRDDGIAIIEINEGVEVNAEMAQEVTDLAISVLGDAPLALLSNRIHSYSLSFEAMSALANLPNLIALAIVLHSEKSQLLIKTQNFFITAMRKKPVKIFTDMNIAIDWLHKELKGHTS